MYATARAGALVDAGFDPMPTFSAPHYSLILPSYTEGIAAQLIDLFGEVKPNPHYNPRREP